MSFPQTYARLELQSDWHEYYRLRNRARPGMISLFFILLLFLMVPPSLINKVMTLLLGLRPWLQTTLALSAWGLVALIPCALVLQWIEWRCPRCGKKFAQPGVAVGVFILVAVFWKLIADSRCGSCQLRCGS